MGIALSSANEPLTESDLMRAFGKSRTTVQAWKQQGMPVGDLSKAVDWVLSKKAKTGRGRNNQNLDAPEGKAELETRKLQLVCEKLKHELDVARGLVHDKEKCSAGLVELAAQESRVLHQLGDKLASMFPELGAKIKEATDREVDAILLRLRGDSK